MSPKKYEDMTAKDRAALHAKEYAQTAANQRAYLRKIAERIESGEPLEALDRMFAASIVRNHASRIPDKAKHAGPGRPPLVAAGDVTFLYWLLVTDGVKPGKAKNRIAKDLDLGIERVREIVREWENGPNSGN